MIRKRYLIGGIPIIILAFSSTYNRHTDLSSDLLEMTEYEELNKTLKTMRPVGFIDSASKFKDPSMSAILSDCPTRTDCLH